MVLCTRKELALFAKWISCLKSLRLYPFVIKEKKVVYKVLNYTTEYYDSHYRAYVITPTGTSTLVYFENIVMPYPIHIRSVFGRQLFILPYHVKND